MTNLVHLEYDIGNKIPKIVKLMLMKMKVNAFSKDEVLRKA